MGPACTDDRSHHHCHSGKADCTIRCGLLKASKRKKLLGSIKCIFGDGHAVRLSKPHKITSFQCSIQRTIFCLIAQALHPLYRSDRRRDIRRYAFTAVAVPLKRWTKGRAIEEQPSLAVIHQHICRWNLSCAWKTAKPPYQWKRAIPDRRLQDGGWHESRPVLKLLYVCHCH